jgi:2-polyprenyl-6-methoxyphenol hydroxylase-like FAD-dependent oxidoreductase
MLIQNKTVAIIGGGPGGLTLARLLQLKNVNVKVYERDFDKNARIQGTTLDLHEDSGLKALRHADLLESFKKYYRPGADRMIITNHNAEVLFSDHEGKPEADFGNEHFRPEIDRGPLRKLLLESLQSETVVWDSHFLEMEKQDLGWLLHFKNGTTAYADIVIGADGAKSKIRPYLTDIKPFYTGITSILGSIENPEKITSNIYKTLNGGKIMAFGSGKFFTLATKGDGSLSFYISYKTDENQIKNLDLNDRAEVLNWFKNEYSDWGNIWHEIFEKAKAPFMPIPIYSMPIEQTWEAQYNLTLLGDAAHLMPPFAGEGVNVAMLDALELSQILCNEEYDDIKTAITSYENQMRSRAAMSAKESLINGERMHSENALNDMLAFFKSMHEQ